LFINGEEVAHVTGKRQGSIAGGHNGLFIGAGVNVPNPNKPTEVLEGDVDEIAVFDRALATDEIGALATGTQPAR
jgi:hypothetical protein